MTDTEKKGPIIKAIARCEAAIDIIIGIRYDLHPDFRYNLMNRPNDDIKAATESIYSYKKQLVRMLEND